jgi:hypothetical protein
MARALRMVIPWLVALSFVAFELAKIMTASANGTDSSTAGLAYLFVIFGAMLLWVVAWVVGKAIAAAVPSSIAAKTFSMPVVVGGLAIVVAGSGILGHQSGLSVARGLAPTVLVDLHRLEPAAFVSSSGEFAPGRVVLYGSSRADTATIGGQLLRFVKDDGRLVLAGASGNRLAVVPLPALEVPFQVEVVPIRRDASGRDALAMMIIGSMRSRQAMLAIVDPAWQVVYQERLIRRWPIRSPTLQILRDSASRRDLLIVTEGSTQRSYRMMAP